MTRTVAGSLHPFREGPNDRRQLPSPPCERQREAEASVGLRAAMTTWHRPLPTFLGEHTPLYTLGEEYVTSVAGAGFVPLLVPHIAPSQADTVLDAVDALVVVGGGDVAPATYGAVDAGSKDTSVVADASEMALLRAARARRLPTLAICRGLQVVNVAFGGTLCQDVTSADSELHPPIPSDPDAVLALHHPVEIEADSRLAEVLGAGTREVNNIHHQAVGLLADGFRCVAATADGVVEAIEPVVDDWPLLAVQWHPEKRGAEDAALFAWLADQARQRARTADRSPAIG